MGGHKDTNKKEIINGYTVIRVGGRYTVYWEAYKYYKKYLQGWADVVIDEINTIPFFTPFYIKNSTSKNMPLPETSYSEKSRESLKK